LLGQQPHGRLAQAPRRQAIKNNPERLVILCDKSLKQRPKLPCEIVIGENSFLSKD
jgi:hypothetical protein